MPLASTTAVNIGFEMLNLEYSILEMPHFDFFFFNIELES